MPFTRLDQMAEAPSAPSPGIETTTTVVDVVALSLADALALGESRWDALRARAESTSPFTRWAWHDAWYHTASDDERDAAFVLVMRDEGGELSALVPLATRRITYRRLGATALTWAVGDRGCPDHMDVLVAPWTALDQIAAAMDDMPWDMLQLDGIASEASGAPRLRAALARRGITAVLRPQWTCPYADLPASWEEYVATRSPARRYTIRRRERRLAKVGAISLTFYAGETRPRGWEHLRLLHDARWDGQGAFDEALDALHRRFAASLSAADRLWLTTMDVARVPVSAWYGFTDGDTLHAYQMGRSPEWSEYGVGGVHTGLIVQHAIARGLRRLDFMRGDEAYKADWATGTRWAQQLVAFRRSTKGRMLQLADRAGTLRDQLSHATTRDPDPAPSA